MKKIKIKIYRSEIELYVGKTKNNIKKLIKRYGKEEADFFNTFSKGFCFGCYITKNNRKVFIMSIDKKSKSEELYHEALHLSYYILDDVGVEHDVDNHESLTYLQGYIARKVKKKM